MKTKLNKNEKMDAIKTEWRAAFDQMMSGKALSKMANATMTKQEYAAILRQIFHQVREHPQALTLLAAKLKGDSRMMVKTLMRHAISEVGHDLLAINDLRALGEDVSSLPSERPLPETAATLGLMYYLLEHQNPLSFLGYLFHLEFTPTAVGAHLVNSLKAAGIPQEALTFIHDHAEVDVGHNKAMEGYVDVLVQTDDDLESVIYAARASARVYGTMLDAAIDNVSAKMSYGHNRAEMGMRIPEPVRHEHHHHREAPTAIAN